MTQDEIIRMAREAGFINLALEPKITRFAALVAAHVTEALTKSHEAAFQSYVDQAKADRELSVLAAVLAEREACAKVCDYWAEQAEARGYTCKGETHVDGFGDGAAACAAAIRARGEK